jgi:hypothetical protein
MLKAVLKKWIQFYAFREKPPISRQASLEILRTRAEGQNYAY